MYLILRWAPNERQPEPRFKVWPRGFRCRLRSPLRRWLLYRQNPFDQSLCWWLCRWGCGRRRALPRFSSWLGKRGSAAGRQSRSSTYPPALCFVHLPQRAIAMALMLALLVVETQPSPDAGLSRGDVAIGMQVNLLVFETAP